MWIIVIDLNHIGIIKYLFDGSTLLVGLATRLSVLVNLLSLFNQVI